MSAKPALWVCLEAKGGFMKPRPLGKLLALSACLACICAGTAWGQATNSADVTGSVTDPSGAVIPQVLVTVKDLDKNLEHSLMTNASGIYDTGPLVPSDRYVI